MYHKESQNLILLTTYAIMHYKDSLRSQTITPLEEIWALLGYYAPKITITPFRNHWMKYLLPTQTAVTSLH